MVGSGDRAMVGSGDLVVSHTHLVQLLQKRGGEVVVSGKVVNQYSGGEK